MSAVEELQTQAAEQEWFTYWKRGPTKLRWTKLPLQVGDPAPDLELQDSSGRSVHLADFWSTGPAVLVFLRHFGCSCARDRVRHLRDEYFDYVRAGATVVLIGQGEPERSAVFVKKYGAPCPLLCDPDYRAYDAYSLLQGKPSQVAYGTTDALLQCDYEAAVEVASAYREAGHPLVDNPWQLPGEFVIDRRGNISLAWRYQYCADFPNPQVLVAAIKEARWEAETD